MKPERWQKLDELFHAALEHAPEERAAFLEDACADDPTLRKHAEALLAAHQEAASFIETPAMDLEAREIAKGQVGRDAGLATGETLTHYRIIAPIGAGGMGQVYLAHDTKLGRKVALKLLPTEFTRNPDRVRRLQQEARAASSLNHQNIITIYEIGHVDDRHFIASEYIDGLTLRRFLKGEKSQVASSHEPPGLQLSETLGIAMQVADALAAAHVKGIVHRDIKPENIMLVREGPLMEQASFVKVLDFGIAKLTEPVPSESAVEATTKVLLNTQEGSVIGTPTYMSPEQARGEVVDARTDVWSLGVVLYEMLSNSAPFAGDKAQDVLAAILKDEPPPLPSLVPDRLRWIVEKALRRNREERYQTAREMFSDLRELQKQYGRGLEAPTVPTRDEPTRTTVENLPGTSKRRRGTAIIALTAFLVAAAAIAFSLFRLSRQQSQTIGPKQPESVVLTQHMKMARLTTTGKASAAAVSPDGKLVVHVVDDGKQESLWIRQVSTSSNVQIIPPAEVNYLGLTFSPGGDYLYYISWDRKSFYTLYQMPILGGAAKRLIQDIDSNVTFSPDGKQYAFLRGYPTQGKVAVLVANADGTAERSLTTRGLVSGPSGDPAWSPDGKIIVYPVENTDADGDFTSLFEVPVAGGSEKSIGSQRWSDVGRMAWLRDGSGFLVIAKEDVASPSQIWYVSYPAGKARRITQDLNDYQDLTLTADSSALVTVQSDQVSNIWTAPNETPGRASQVTTGKFDGLNSLSWTPEGKIVYDSAARGHLDLWVSDSNGTGQKQLTADAGNNSWPSVSPDGRYVVFVSDRTGANHLWRIDIDGSNATQLTQGPGESKPHCLPDGQWVAFNSRLSQRPIMKVPIMGGEAIKMGINAGGALAISPDGKLIAATHWEPANVNTAIYKLEGGEPSKLLDFAGNYLRWTPDGRSVAFVDDRNPSAIISQPIDGGPPKQLADLKPDHIFSFAWSRDGKQLAVARGTLTHDVILITDFIDQR